MTGCFLKGRRIYLRVLTKSDITIWHSWFNDFTVTQYMNKGIFPNTQEAQLEYLNFILKSRNDLQLGICNKNNGLLVGIAGIHKIDWIHRHGEVSILIGDKRHWKKGIATEAVYLIVRHAFIKMNLRRLTAGMASVNEASRKCFETNGFIQEGRLRKHLYCNGKYADVYALGLLKEEWPEREKE